MRRIQPGKFCLPYLQTFLVGFVFVQSNTGFLTLLVVTRAQSGPVRFNLQGRGRTGSCHIHLVADTILLASNYQLKVKVKENRINYNRCILCCQTCLKPIIIFQNPLAVLAYFALSPNVLNPWSCQ